MYWMVWLLLSLIGLKFVFCGIYNNGHAFWLNKFGLWLLSKFWSTINFMTFSSRILANFNLFYASSKSSNISTFSSSCCSLNCFSCNFNFPNFASAVIFSWSANNSTLTNSFLLALELLGLDLDLYDQELFEDA